MRGLALEGGGARGAYHIGVIKALLENGYEFDGFAGTSIGAINAAIMAQGDFELAHKLWANITMDHIFDIDEQAVFKLRDISELWADKQLSKDVRRTVSKIIGNRGINTDKIKKYLKTYIDEDKIRASGKDLGLVTVSISERKPYEVMLNDIPHGKLVKFVMASATFPGFKPEVIDDKAFIDGGIYDNCPMNLLLHKGYDEVITVRTNSPGVVRKAIDPSKVRYITPSNDLGPLMWFSPENSKRNITAGYHDGLLFIDNHSLYDTRQSI